MRYSAIIGEGFHNIGLSVKDQQRVDAHFIAAAHHRVHSVGGSSFHIELYWKHVRALFCIVYNGDFSQANDPSNRLLDRKEMWNPKRIDIVDHARIANDHVLPDPEMFIFMPADARYGLDEDHPYDLLLEKNLFPSLHQALV